MRISDWSSDVCSSDLHPIMDGNVKRVFTRYFGIAGDPARRAVEQSLWDIAETAIADSTHEIDIARYTQGLMDLGATVCSRTRPRCDACPLASNCYARSSEERRVGQEGIRTGRT